MPRNVISDLGSKLSLADNYVAWSPKKEIKGWDWAMVKEMGARVGTMWDFVPTGCQFRNELAKSWVKALKSTLKHILASTIIQGRPTLTYAELHTTLAIATNIVNSYWGVSAQ